MSEQPLQSQEPIVCTVRRLTGYGAIVEMPSGRNQRERDAQLAQLEIGDRITVYVIEIERTDKRLLISFSGFPPERKEELVEYAAA